MSADTGGDANFNEIADWIVHHVNRGAFGEVPR